jgi:PAS domain S-box-containing protein
VFIVLFQLPAGAQVKEVRRVLVFSELGLSSPAVALADREIRAVLENSPYQIELYREYLETTLFPDPATQQEFRSWYIHKYRERRPDVIIALGPSPLKFLVDSHEEFFEGIPIVFGGTGQEQADNPKLDSHFTGVWARFEPTKTLDAALRLQPRTRHVVVVGGMSSFDRHLEAIFKEQLRGYETKLDLTYLTDLDMPALLERLKHLPDHSIVLYTHIGLDAGGTRYVGASQAGPMVVSAANAPVFGTSDVDLGRGAVGGHLDSFEMEGKIIGEMAVRILNRQKPQDIPIVRGASVYMFDWRALQRWGLKERNLPPGSVVLYRQPSFWQRYKWYISAGIFLLLAQTLLILALLLQRAKRKQAEAEQRENQLRLDGIIDSAMDAVIAIDDGHRIVVFNAAAERMFGCPGPDAIGSSIDRFIPERFHAAHRAHIRHFGDTASTTRTMGNMRPVWGLRANGEEFPIEASISQTKVGGRKLFTVIIRDITERFRAEQALRRSEEYSREVVLHSPVAMAVTRGPRREIEAVNIKFTELFGYTIEDVPDEALWWPLAYPDKADREAVKAEWQRRVEKAL